MSIFKFFKKKKQVTDKPAVVWFENVEGQVNDVSQVKYLYDCVEETDYIIDAENTPEKIIQIGKKEVFVFGSNQAGSHAGGAARIALNQFGAIWGQGEGLQGNSYAIPTMQGGVETRRVKMKFLLGVGDLVLSDYKFTFKFLSERQKFSVFIA